MLYTVTRLFPDFYRRLRIRGFFVSLVLIFFLIPAFLNAGEKENFDKVTRALKDNRIPYEERLLLSDYDSLGRSLLVRSPGRNDADHTLGTFVFAVPLYAEFAVDTALAMSEMLGSEHSTNIIIAFLGDEPDYIGLKDLLTLTDMPDDWVLCYFDTDEKPGGFHIRHGRRGYVAPLDIIKPLPPLFKSRGLPWAFRIRFNEIFKLEQVEGPEVLAITNKEEISSFVISEDLKYKLPEENVTANNLAELFIEYTAFLNFPVLNADRHYFSFAFPGGDPFYISQGQTAALTLVMAGFFLLLFLVYSVRNDANLFFHFKLFMKYIWIFFIFLPLMIFSIKISGIIYSALCSALNASFETANYGGAGLTFALTALIFFLPSPLLDLFRFPRRSKLYGFSAVLFVIIGMFVAAILDFSYIRLFLWAFFFVFLGAFTSNPILIFACILMVPIFPLGALLNLVEIGSGLIVESFTSSEWRSWANWAPAFQTTLFFLPLFLLGKRATILIQKSKRRGLEIKPNRRYRLIAIPISIAVILAAMIIQILISRS